MEGRPAKILADLIEALGLGDGFETYPFRIGSYNKAVAPDFELPYGPDTLAILVLSTPRMFDGPFRLWLRDRCVEAGGLSVLVEELTNPLEGFVTDRFNYVLEAIGEEEVDVFHDFSLHPNRKPKILMCTCGHVAGAAYYYQPRHYTSGDWPTEEHRNSKMIGLSLHPRYGAHFAFRSVFVFPNVTISEAFQEPAPISVLRSEAEAREAIDLFNWHWRDGKFRDCGAPKERYSQTQVAYFAKPPRDRWAVIAHWFEDIPDCKRE